MVGVSPAYPFPDAHAHGIQGRTTSRHTTYASIAQRPVAESLPIQAVVHVGVFFESYLVRAK